jgi:hypothetical protein
MPRKRDRVVDHRKAGESVASGSPVHSVMIDDQRVRSSLGPGLIVRRQTDINKLNFDFNFEFVQCSFIRYVDPVTIIFSLL